RLGLAGGRGGGALGDPPQHGRHGQGLGGTDGGGVRGCPVRPLVRGWRDGPPRRPRRPPPVVRTDEAPPPRGLTRPRVPARPSVRRGPGLLVSRGGTVDPAPELEEPVTAVVEDLDWVEHAARMFEPDPPPPPPKWATPGEMALALDPRTVQTGALDLIDDALKWALETPDSRLIISMPPQEGKSQRASRRFPLWCLTQNPELRVAIISYEANVARRWGRAIRDDVEQHSEELGLRVRDDLSAQHEWQRSGHDGGVYTAGLAGALTGRPVDLTIIDDPMKDREEADSEVYRERAWDWWTDTGSTRLAPGAPVILILTRWHHDDLAGRLLAAEDGKLWRVVNIPAQADHRPEKGETDPLGRKPGEFMDSARRRTKAQWEAIKVRSGPRTWGSLYQGRPTPLAGGLFPQEWARYETPFHLDKDNGVCWVPGANWVLVQSWDLAFKDLA